jgi:hypothetical protein
MIFIYSIKLSFIKFFIIKHCQICLIILLKDLLLKFLKIFLRYFKIFLYYFLDILAYMAQKIITGFFAAIWGGTCYFAGKAYPVSKNIA